MTIACIYSNRLHVAQPQIETGEKVCLEIMRIMSISYGTTFYWLKYAYNAHTDVVVFSVFERQINENHDAPKT